MQTADPTYQDCTLSDPSARVTEFDFSVRRGHSLYLSKDSADFSRRFEDEFSQSVHDFVSTLLHPGQEFVAFAVGSIPLGVGSSASDIDLYVVLESRDAIVEEQVGSRNSNSSAAFVAWNRALISLELVRIVAGVEVNVAFILRAGWEELVRHLAGKGPELNEREIAILSRLRTGWPLSWAEEYLERCRPLVSSAAVDVFCCTKFYWVGQKFLEKAEKALTDGDLDLATHLIRVAAERTCQAYLASRGMAHAGVKWITYLKRMARRGSRAGDTSLEALLNTTGLPLVLLGRLGSPEGGRKAVTDLRTLLVEARCLIEKNVLFKIALQACPQVRATTDAA
jgi:hypothetical protein